MQQHVIIDGHTYLAISSAKVTRANTVPKYTLESGVEITDHIKIGAPQFALTLIVTEDEYLILDALSQDPRLFSVVFPQGAYDAVALVSISDQYSDAINLTRCDLTLAVQTITRTSTIPGEIDGFVTSEYDLTGIPTVPIVSVPDAATVEQLKNYYIDHLIVPIWQKEAEIQRMKEMTTKELWSYLTETQQNLEIEDQLEAITNELATGDARQKIDIDIGSWANLIVSAGAKFTHNNTTYEIQTRVEPIKGWWASSTVDVIIGDKILHATVTRSIDMAVVYNGPIYDLTPFVLRDPNTSIVLATLQWSKYYGRLYIA